MAVQITQLLPVGAFSLGRQFKPSSPAERALRMTVPIWTPTPGKSKKRPLEEEMTRLPVSDSRPWSGSYFKSGGYEDNKSFDESDLEAAQIMMDLKNCTYQKSQSQPQQQSQQQLQGKPPQQPLQLQLQQPRQQQPSLPTLSTLSSIPSLSSLPSSSLASLASLASLPSLPAHTCSTKLPLDMRWKAAATIVEERQNLLSAAMMAQSLNCKCCSGSDEALLPPPSKSRKLSGGSGVRGGGRRRSGSGASAASQLGGESTAAAAFAAGVAAATAANQPSLPPNAYTFVLSNQRAPAGLAAAVAASGGFLPLVVRGKRFSDISGSVPEGFQFLFNVNGTPLMNSRGRHAVICDLCERVLEDPSSAYRHRDVHFPTKEFKCPVANCKKNLKGFSKRYNTVTHLMSVHKFTAEDYDLFMTMDRYYQDGIMRSTRHRELHAVVSQKLGGPWECKEYKGRMISRD